MASNTSTDVAETTLAPGSSATSHAGLRTLKEKEINPRDRHSIASTIALDEEKTAPPPAAELELKADQRPAQASEWRTHKSWE